ncbi:MULTISPECIES: class Ib ribonucleoside-diphosphate reductase assembly flavoprotein NrdI [Brevibacterium]|uniref:Protein NrdI n=1 Tax=Brevibacterium salitolerans TaxID=1403566 RepID=A0ABN2WY03_9MICO|nr:class Ib ribonucleoside-diphosphate reductase assembly flavoprotein NrdI [Brevibacterium sp.]
MLVVYYSSPSEYTHRFAAKLHHPVRRLPLLTKDEMPVVDEPFVLITPTYGAGPHRGSVPKQVIKFLNIKANRERLRGVIGAGNTNFGENYCRAADIVSAKCGVPVLYRFELLGMPGDAENVDKGLDELCQASAPHAT